MPRSILKTIIDGVVHIECSKCNVVKPETCFYNFKKSRECKECRKVRGLSDYAPNRIVIDGKVIHGNTKRHGVEDGKETKQCTNCKEWKILDEYNHNKTKADGYNAECRICQHTIGKSWRETNTEYNKQRQKNWEQENKDERRIKKKERRKIPLVKIKETLRRRQNEVLKGMVKVDSSIKLNGCSAEELWEHLSKKFDSRMTRTNHGYDTWHVDHIIPCAYFDLSKPSHQRRCFNWRNMQPMWGKENMSKSNKLPEGYETLLEELEELFPSDEDEEQGEAEESEEQETESEDKEQDDPEVEELTTAISQIKIKKLPPKRTRANGNGSIIKPILNSK
jgi:DNA segregation ATPase FtsK/SpoIIIE-like protein